MTFSIHDECGGRREHRPTLARVGPDDVLVRVRAACIDPRDFQEPALAALRRPLADLQRAVREAKWGEAGGGRAEVRARVTPQHAVPDRCRVEWHSTNGLDFSDRQP